MRVIGIHTLHDANVTIAVDGEIRVVLELERLFEERYFCSASKPSKFREQWTKAIKLVQKEADIKEFDVAVTSWVLPSQKRILETIVRSQRWVTVDHHRCHATIGFYDSPFNKALVLSYDGGGNDGTFNIFFGERSSGVRHEEWVGLNLGTPYRQIATCMPEVTGKAPDEESLTQYMKFAPLNLSGKLMGYVALGSVREEWCPPVRQYYTRFVNPLQSLFTLGEQIGLSLEPNALDEKNARDLAATSQFIFEELLCGVVEERLKKYTDVDGIVLTGGCALNVNANQLVLKRFGLPVHVPSAPNDCGITVGAVWATEPPKVRKPMQYAGLPLQDLPYLKKIVEEREPRKVGVEELARLIVEDGAIVGIARGTQELGPRALGHRSIVCFPDKPDLKEKLNKLKSREWFRPLCPSIAQEAMHKFFEGQEAKTLSPYMSFAPPLKQEMRAKFPAICHYDGTARVQTVTPEDDQWYHSLLSHVGKLSGYEILLNTSFNVKGQPILNKVESAISILDSGGMDYVLIEDWLFKPKK